MTNGGSSKLQARAMEIHHIDVAQGEATLIRIFGDGKEQFNVLIDGGMATNADGIADYMTENGAKLDAIVCTHYDADHMGGLIDLMSNHPDQFNDKFSIYDRGDWVYAITTGGTRGRPQKIELAQKTNLDNDRRNYWNAALDLIEKKRATWKTKENGDDAGDMLMRNILADHVQGVQATCVSVNGLQPGGRRALNPMEGHRAENSRSLALLVEFDQFTYFTGGDLEKDGEKNVAAWLRQREEDKKNAGAPPKERVLSAFKAGHHGAETSTSHALLALKPMAAFISAGSHAHKHPRQQTVDALQGSNSIQNYYLTNYPAVPAGLLSRIGVPRPTETQVGKARVGGANARATGTNVLRVTRDSAKEGVFAVIYQDTSDGFRTEVHVPPNGGDGTGAMDTETCEWETELYLHPMGRGITRITAEHRVLLSQLASRPVPTSGGAAADSGGAAADMPVDAVASDEPDRSEAVEDLDEMDVDVEDDDRRDPDWQPGRGW